MEVQEKIKPEGKRKQARFKAIKFAAVVFSFAAIIFSAAAEDMFSAGNTADKEKPMDCKRNSGTFSVSISPLFYAGLGTESKEPHIKSSMEKAENAGFSTGFCYELNGGISSSFLWRTPFSKKTRTVFAGADFSYLNKNGFKAKIDSAEHEYSYRSIEFSPILAYRRETGQTSQTERLKPEKNPFALFFSFSLGSNFSFPLGKADYRFRFLSESSDSFKIKTFCVPGILCAADFGFRIKDFEIFTSVKYINDFSPVKYSPDKNPQAEEKNADELMTRRCVLLALGARYLF